MRELDLAIFRWINGWPDGLSPIFVFFSEGNKWTWVRLILLGVIFGMLIFGKQRGRKAILLAILCIGLSNELTDLLKAGFEGLRPSVELVDANFRVKKLTSFGTASAHSANMAAIATVMTLLVGRWGWIWIGVAFLTGLSRIYVGVHYPYQVLFGWICGILVSLAVVKGYELAVRKFRKPTEDDLDDEVPELA